MYKEITKQELKRVQLLLDQKLYNQLVRYVSEQKIAGKVTSHSKVAREAIKTFLNENK